MKYKRIKTLPGFAKELRLFFSTIKNTPRHRMTTNASKLTCDCSLSYLKGILRCFVPYELCRTCKYNRKVNGTKNNYDW